MQVTNKKASFNYEVIDTYIAGIVLLGKEIKSIREGKVSISESFCTVDKGELIMHKCNISSYKMENPFCACSPDRDRKLLLKKIEIRRLFKASEQKGYTIIPLSLFINEKGLAKVKIGLCKGKHDYDKRESIKERDTKRHIEKNFFK